MANEIRDARDAAKEHRYERAIALALIDIALVQRDAVAALRDIANALHDDDNNNLTHIAHNMSYQLAVIARNTGAIDDEGDEGDEDMPTLDAPGAHAFIVGGNLPY